MGRNIPRGFCPIFSFPIELSDRIKHWKLNRKILGNLKKYVPSLGVWIYELPENIWSTGKKRSKKLSLLSRSVFPIFLPHCTKRGGMSLLLTADLQEISEITFENYQRRLSLIETLTDEGIDELTKKELRQDYCRFHQVSDRTIRNYLKKYREKGSAALLFYKKREKAIRFTDEKIRKKILDLLEELL